MLIVPEDYVDNEQGNGLHREDSMAGDMMALMDSGKASTMSPDIVRRTNSIQTSRGRLCGNGQECKIDTAGCC